jgi:broad specificity phosphatase PhoE
MAEIDVSGVRSSRNPPHVDLDAPKLARARRGSAAGVLTLVAHASTAATSRAAFAYDEGLEPRGAVAAAAARLRRVTRALCSPAPAAVETAAALGLSATPDPGLSDWQLGDWRGRTLAEVAADVPDAAAAWLADPDAAPHGGETLTALLARVAQWLAGRDAEGHTVAVTHAAVVRAAVVATLGAPADGFWRIDVAPLTATVLRGGPARWTVRGTALPL